MRRRMLQSIAAGLLIAAVVAGCGGTSGTSGNGVASKSADDIVVAATRAFDGAQSAHVSGSVVRTGTNITLDLTLAGDKGGRGRMALNSASFQIVSLSREVYLNGSSAFWIKAGAPTEAAHLLDRKWVRAPASGQLAPLARYVQTRGLVDTLLASHGSLSKGGTSTVNGQKVVAVHDRSRGGTLYVATTGQPYPIQLSSGSSRIVFDRYNQPVSLTAPAHSVDLSSLS